ncbi:unnamed protein product [Withania somnifera]
MKTKASLMFLVLFLFLLLLGAAARDCCGSFGAWASPVTSGSGTKFTQHIKTTEDYAGYRDVFDDVYRQHEDIPSPGVGN